MKLIFILLTLITFTLSANKTYKSEPDLKNKSELFQENKVSGVHYENHILSQTLFGLLGSGAGASAGMVLGAGAGALIGLSIKAVDSSNDEIVLGTTMLGLGIGSIVGYILGTSFGVYSSGNDENQKGSFSSTLIGTSIGFAISVPIAYAFNEIELKEVSIIAIVYLPIIAGIIGFNSSIKYKSVLGASLININNGNVNLGLPTYYIQKSTYDRNRSIDMFSVINMKF